MDEFKQIELHANGLRFPAFEMGSGPLVLCLHGFPDTKRSFRHQIPALAKAGYRVVAPTMRGYDPRCVPADRDYRVARLAEDVVGWLDALGEQSAHLMGHDHGSFAASAACIVAPERFRSLVLIAVPHPAGLNESILKYPSQLLNSWYTIFFQLRPLARYYVERNDWALIEKLWRDWSPGWKWPAEELAAVKLALAQPGVKDGALGYYWTTETRLTKDGKQTTDRVCVPTLGLTGALDGCIDTRLFDLTLNASSCPKGFEIARIPDAGHFVHQEKPEQVNALLLDWLGRHV